MAGADGSIVRPKSNASKCDGEEREGDGTTKVVFAVQPAGVNSNKKARGLIGTAPTRGL
jgi:hypothetical protein